MSDTAAAVTAIRSKSVVLLGEALQDSSPLLDLGVDVEAAIATAHDAGSTGYTTAVRTLVAALRRNVELREVVHSKQLKPADLVALPPEALATAEQRSARAAIEERAALKATVSLVGDAAVPTHDHMCPSCSSREVLKLNVGGVRDIGKSETWGSKDASDEKARIRLHCTTCQVRVMLLHNTWGVRPHTYNDADVYTA
jgi:Transcription factor S-II (TFIIS), central domain